MDKIQLTNYATDVYNRFSYNTVLQLIQKTLNRAADGYLFNTVSVTSTYTANINDGIILANGTFTVTIPAADQCKDKRYAIKNSGTGVITISSTSGNIDGAGTIVLNVTMEAVDLVSDGAHWWVI